MKHIFSMTAAALALAFVCGCQAVTKVEFFEPTPNNTDYCVKTTEKVQGHGPVKLIEGKSGVPDFSDNKTFSMNFNILGL